MPALSTSVDVSAANGVTLLVNMHAAAACAGMAQSSIRYANFTGPLPFR